MTKIEWTHRAGARGKSWNSLRVKNKETGGVGHFCEKVSPGCRNCYAETFQKRFKNPIRYAAQDAEKVEVFLDQKELLQPLHWKKPKTIFVCSQTDLFLRHYSDEWIDQVFAVMALCPQHTFIVLTKRPERMQSYLASPDTGMRQIMAAYGLGLTPPGWRPEQQDSIHASAHLPLPNAWLGTSVEDQATADERIPVLLDTPAVVRFISAEPLLGPVSFEGRFVEHPSPAYHVNWIEKLDWVIVGGESGHKASPMHPDWARSLRDQCKAANVPFFFKQHGAWVPWEAADAPFWQSQNGEYRDGHSLFPCDMESDPNWNDGLSFVSDDAAHVVFQKVGKKVAGRLLDGQEHNAFPEVIL
jgi:protein gp37